MERPFRPSRKHTNEPQLNIASAKDHASGSGVALLLVDVLNDLQFEGNDYIVEGALDVGRRIRTLKERCSKLEIPVFLGVICLKERIQSCLFERAVHLRERQLGQMAQQPARHHGAHCKLRYARKGARRAAGPHKGCRLLLERSSPPAKLNYFTS